MKKTLVLMFLVILSNRAVAADTLLTDLNELVVRCSVQPYSLDANGTEVDGDPVSICSEVKVHGKHAVVSLDGKTLRADLTVSPDADGGDLDMLVVRSSDGQIVESLNNVPAFGSVLSALALGHTESFRKIQR